MDCRDVKKLLPLWVGQDLPDAATTNDVTSHLERCPECARLRDGLLASLEVLQACSAETLAVESPRHEAGSSGTGPRSVWPKLATRITAWEGRSRHAQFNGWIPAAVMSLAAAVMVAVSLPSIQDEFFNNQSFVASSIDLFQAPPEFSQAPAGAKVQNPSNRTDKRSPVGTPVIYKSDQW